MPKKQLLRDGNSLPTPEHGRCPNCDASMLEYIYNVDILQVLLLISMGNKVKERMKEGLDFTVANQIHVPSLPISHAIKCRTTQASKLGLVVKLKGNGSRGVWAITARGFNGLAGHPVPSMVKVFRNKIEEHFNETITFEDAKRVHTEAVAAAHLRNKDPKRDHRAELEGYKSEEWFAFGGIHQGKLL